MPSEFNSSFLQELEMGLRDLETRTQRRDLAEVCGVNFCSNDYLGLAEHPALKESVLQAVKDSVRVGGTGSRLLSGHAAIWSEVEEEFASFAGTEAALYFGSGYVANLGLISSLIDRDDLIFSDELNHASLIDGIRLSSACKVIYPHLDLDMLESELREHNTHPGRKLIVTESIFSMDGDVAPLGELLSLADRYGAGLVVDEAHATAVCGPSGKGIAMQASVVPGLTAVVHTCGKGPGSAGAFVCGSTTLKEHLINHARTFIFSTAMPPYMAAQVRAALRLSLTMDKQREALRSHSQQLVSDLRNVGWDTTGSSTHIIPVVLGENDAAQSVAEYLRHEGFAVRAIRPPTVPKGAARLRFSLTCTIAPRELARLEESLNAWRAQHHHLAVAERA